MSTGEFIHAIPQRFREERERLGFSRAELAAVLDVNADTVKNWEGKKQLYPNAAALAKLHEVGADIFFIVTGKRGTFTTAEQDTAAYAVSPSRQLAAKVGTMTLTATDADLLLDVAKRLALAK